MAELFAMNSKKKSVSLNVGDRSPWILKGLLSSCFDISDDESGMAIDILFKSWVEATEQPAQQMTQNRTIRNQRINESTRSRLSDMYVVLNCFLFTFYVTPENIN